MYKINIIILHFLLFNIILTIIKFTDTNNKNISWYPFEHYSKNEKLLKNE